MIPQLCWDVPRHCTLFCWLSTSPHTTHHSCKSTHNLQPSRTPSNLFLEQGNGAGSLHLSGVIGLRQHSQFGSFSLERNSSSVTLLGVKMSLSLCGSVRCNCCWIKGAPYKWCMHVAGRWRLWWLQSSLSWVEFYCCHGGICELEQNVGALLFQARPHIAAREHYSRSWVYNT